MSRNRETEALHPWDNGLVGWHRCELCDRLFECDICTQAAISTNKLSGFGQLYAPEHRPGRERAHDDPPRFICKECR
jgi:hypothetical protein